MVGAAGPYAGGGVRDRGRYESKAMSGTTFAARWWMVAYLVATGCGQGDSTERDQDDPEPLPVDAEDHLPDDIYSVKQRYQAFFDSVMAERLSLLATVGDRRQAIDAYVKGEDARGIRFAGDGVVQTALEDCLRRSDRFADETIPEAEELMQALDREHVGIERFKLRFQRFDAAWVVMNDCWRDVWADPTFDAWLLRHAAQGDSLAEEERQRRLAAARRAEAARLAAAAEAARDRAFNECVTLRRSGLRRAGFAPRWKIMDGDKTLMVFVRKLTRNAAIWELDSWADDLPEWVDLEFWKRLPIAVAGSRAISEHLYDQWRHGGLPGCKR